MLQWLISQPESRLSAKWAQMDALNIPTTFLRPEIGLNPVHEPLVRRNLISHLDHIAGDIWEEAGMALEDLWGKDTDAWKKVNLDYTVRRVVARASNRIFVGEELCKSAKETCVSLTNVNQGRNNEYLENSIKYVNRVSACGLLLNLFPVWFKCYLSSSVKIPIQIAYSRCSKYLLPLFVGLIENKTHRPLHLFSSWLVSSSEKDISSSPERTPDFLSRRIMALNFAAIHTSTLTTCNLLLDIFSQPQTASLLRDECLANNANWNETWNHTRLNQYARLDSSLRESLRLWGLVARAFVRKVIQPEGITLPNGQHLPQGVTVSVSGWGLHHDAKIYAQPFDFIHDRFMRASSEQDETKTVGAGRASAVETDVNFAAWGIGKHACPGRFFAADLIKVILAHVLIDYEIELLEERPDNWWVEYNVIPPPAVISVKRRKIG